MPSPPASANRSRSAPAHEAVPGAEIEERATDEAIGRAEVLQHVDLLASRLDVQAHGVADHQQGAEPEQHAAAPAPARSPKRSQPSRRWRHTASCWTRSASGRRCSEATSRLSSPFGVTISRLGNGLLRRPHRSHRPARPRAIPPGPVRACAARRRRCRRARAASARAPAPARRSTCGLEEHADLARLLHVAGKARDVGQHQPQAQRQRERDRHHADRQQRRPRLARDAAEAGDEAVDVVVEPRAQPPEHAGPGAPHRAVHRRLRHRPGPPGRCRRRAWPWSSTSTRFFMRLTRPRSWLATSTLVPRSGSDANSAMISADSVGSRLPVGSSATSSAGSATMARAMPTRCCSPADNCVGNARSRARESELVEHAAHALADLAAAACRAGSAAARRCRRRCDRSAGDGPGTRRRPGAGACDTRRPRTLRRLRSSNSTAPRLGRSARWMSLSSVLLPAPEWPVTNSISPGCTSKLTSDSATWPPGYCLLTLSKRSTLIDCFGSSVRPRPGCRGRLHDRILRPVSWPRAPKASGGANAVAGLAHEKGPASAGPLVLRRPGARISARDRDGTG